MPRPVDSLETFFAHALAIEREAARAYAFLESHFESKGEEVLAGLCRTLANAEREDFERLVLASEGLVLPRIRGERYAWLDAGAPESAVHAVLDRVATPRQLLDLALEGENNARRFFRSVARQSSNEAVRSLARRLAAEEAQHARWVREALDYDEPAADWQRRLARSLAASARTRADS
jgi:rubrerythrin